MRRLPVLVALSLACATTPSKPAGRHTAEELKSATFQLRPLMPATEVEQLLGPPDSTDASSCGGLYGPAWKCTTWEYVASDDVSAGNLRLRFQGESALVLNSW